MMACHSNRLKTLHTRDKSSCRKKRVKSSVAVLNLLGKETGLLKVSEKQSSNSWLFNLRIQRVK